MKIIRSLLGLLAVFYCSAVLSYQPQPWDGSSIVTVDTLASFIGQVDVDAVTKVQNGTVLLPVDASSIDQDAKQDIKAAFIRTVQAKLDVQNISLPAYISLDDYYFYNKQTGEYNVPAWNDFDYIVGFLFAYAHYELQVIEAADLRALIMTECAIVFAQYDIWTEEKMEVQLQSWDAIIAELKKEQCLLTAGHESDLKEFLQLAHVFLLLEMYATMFSEDQAEQYINHEIFHDDMEAMASVEVFSLWYVIMMYGQIPF